MKVLSLHPWQPGLLLVLSLLTAGYTLWFSSDLRTTQRLSGKQWHYQHLMQKNTPTTLLMLHTSLSTYQENGIMRLLPKGAIQIESRINLGESHRPAQIRIRIQGSWAVNSGFMLFKADNYSALPLDEAGLTLLERHKDALRELVLAQFNNTRAFILLDDDTLLLEGDNQRLWGLKGSPLSPAS